MSNVLTLSDNSISNTPRKKSWMVTAAAEFKPELTVERAPLKTPAINSPGTHGMSPITCITNKGNSWSDFFTNWMKKTKKNLKLSRTNQKPTGSSLLCYLMVWGQIEVQIVHMRGCTCKGEQVSLGGCACAPVRKWELLVQKLWMWWTHWHCEMSSVKKTLNFLWIYHKTKFYSKWKNSVT